MTSSCPPSPTSSLTDYVAVPGRIIPIPGTEYVIITPDVGLGSSYQADNQAKYIPSFGKSQIPQGYSAPPGPSDSRSFAPEAQHNVVPAQPSSHRRVSPRLSAPPPPKRGRGRPPHTPGGCKCPNCQVTPNSDRHLCHFPSCAQTFTKVCHLEAHIRNHRGTRPFKCHAPSCNSSFVRADDLRRHSWTHDGSLNRWQCQICSKRFRRADHYKAHVTRCLAARGVTQQKPPVT